MTSTGPAADAGYIGETCDGGNGACKWSDECTAGTQLDDKCPGSDRVKCCVPNPPDHLTPGNDAGTHLRMLLAVTDQARLSAAACCSTTRAGVQCCCAYRLYATSRVFVSPTRIGSFVKPVAL